MSSEEELEAERRELQKERLHLQTERVQLERARVELESEKIKLNEIIEFQRIKIENLEKELAGYRKTVGAEIVAASNSASSPSAPASSVSADISNSTQELSSPVSLADTASPKSSKSKEKSGLRKSGKSDKKKSGKSKEKSSDDSQSTGSTKKKKKSSKNADGTSSPAEPAESADAAASPAVAPAAALAQVAAQNDVAQKSSSAPASTMTLGAAARVPSLDRSNKQLSEFPDEIWTRAEWLQKLYLFKNAIKIIPDKIGTLQQLQLIDLNNNAITELPTAIGLLPKLKELLVSDNRITKFPSMSSMVALTRLDLTSNGIVELPAAICQIPNLVNLNLAFNSLKTLPSELSNLKTLEILRLNNNQLEALPASLGELPVLQSLECRNNKISSIDEKVGELKYLSYLDLAHNALAEMPGAFRYPSCQMAALAHLDLSYNKIVTIAEDFFEDTALDALEVLLLGHNQLEQVPLGLDNLTHLDLKNNKISEITSDISNLSYLNTLDLSCNSIESLPDEILYLNSMQQLNLFGNRLKSIPRLSDLYYMTHLNVGFNQLSEIDLSGLESLDELVISGNKDISALPEDFDQCCPQLRVFYASGCSIESVPECICNMSSLEQIDLSDNKLTTLPSNLENLESLQVLSVAHNQIVNSSERPTTKEADSSLPWDCQEFWRELSALHEVDLSFNKLEYVPLGIEDVRGEVLLSGNPLANGQVNPSPQASLHEFIGGDRFEVGWAEMVGRRNEMEDRFCVRGGITDSADLYCVFDGHAGRMVADFAAKVAPTIVKDKLAAGVDPKTIVTTLFGEINAQYKEQVASRSRDTQARTCGATAVVVLIVDSVAYIANVGDARVVSSAGEALTVDHKPRLEIERLRSLEGGFVTGEGCGRINGLLAVSRSLGDFYMHPWVTSEPHVQTLDLKASKCSFLILACDGVWDEVPNDVAAQIVSGQFAEGRDPEAAARRLRDAAFAFGSDDNISVMIVKMKV